MGTLANKFAAERLRLLLSLSIILLFLTSVLGLWAPPPAESQTPPGGLYNRVITRYYRSSIDGAVLPCSIFVPKKSTYPVRVPVWGDLHAIGGAGAIDYFFHYLAWAYQLNMMIISPWGRNYFGSYVDGKLDPNRPPEPYLFDDFCNNQADSWVGVTGDWGSADESYLQSDRSDSWKVAVRAGSAGADHTVTADIRLLEPSTDDGDTEVSAGLVVRRQANGDCYLADLCRGGDGYVRIRLFKVEGGRFHELKSMNLGKAFRIERYHNLKVFLFEDNIRVLLNYETRILVSDATFSSGEDGLASYGGRHQFDNVRIQNEMPFGETDIIDSIRQCLEETSVDPLVRPDLSRVFISGLCMGGTGAWNLGLHYPDLFAYIHPSLASTDTIHTYNWVKTHYPDQDGEVFRKEQDYNLCAAARAIMHGREPDSGDVEVSSTFHEFGARFILENALNTPVRLEHAEYDSLVPNTTNPLTIKYKTVEGKTVVVKGGDERPSSGYANAQCIWQTWANTPGLYNCVPETNLYDCETGQPEPITETLGIWNNTDYSARFDCFFGAHGCGTVAETGDGDDYFFVGKILRSFLRLNRAYGHLHNDPEVVAYKTYDNQRNKAWWLKMDIAYPDRDIPGLARIHRDRAGNSVDVHVKNVETTTLDLMRMGLDTKVGPLTVNVDNNTAPESEFPVEDLHWRTNLRIYGEWSPYIPYDVRVDGRPTPYSLTATTMAIDGVPTGRTSVVTVSGPQGPGNLLDNPGFECGKGPVPGWSYSQTGGGTGYFEHAGSLPVDEKMVAHTGKRSVRINNPCAREEPYISSWDSSPVNVMPGREYSAGAFVKTGVLRSNNRVYVNGKYSESPRHNSYARLGITWLDGEGPEISTEFSEGIRDTNDWSPLCITATAPPGAARARVRLACVSPDAGGAGGSAWFDDVSFRTAPLGPEPTVRGVTPTSGRRSTVVDITDLSGTGFQEGASVLLVNDNFAVRATDVNVVSSNEISCRADLNGAQTGEYDVIVRNPDGGYGCREKAFSVYSPGPCGNGGGAAAILPGVLTGILSLAGFRSAARSGKRSG